MEDKTEMSKVPPDVMPTNKQHLCSNSVVKRGFNIMRMDSTTQSYHARNYFIFQRNDCEVNGTNSSCYKIIYKEYTMT